MYFGSEFFSHEFLKNKKIHFLTNTQVHKAMEVIQIRRRLSIVSEIITLVVECIIIGFGSFVLQKHYDFHQEKITIWSWICVEVACQFIMAPSSLNGLINSIRQMQYTEIDPEGETLNRIIQQPTCIGMLNYTASAINGMLFIWGSIIYSQIHDYDIPYDLWIFFAVMYWYGVISIIIICMFYCIRGQTCQQ